MNPTPPAERPLHPEVAEAIDQLQGDSKRQRRVLTIILTLFAVFGAGLSAITYQLGIDAETVNDRTEEILVEVETLTDTALPQFLYYLEDEFQVVDVTRTDVFFTATPCITGTPATSNLSLRRIAFVGAEPAWAPLRSFPLDDVPFELSAETADAEGCTRFEAFATRFPDELADLLAENPAASPTMVVRYRVETFDAAGRRGQDVLISSEPFTIPAAA